MTSTDTYDGALSALRNNVDGIAVALAIWEHRSEPDAHARRCVNDAMDAVDAMLAGLHGNPGAARHRDPGQRRRHRRAGGRLAGRGPALILSSRVGAGV